MNRLIHGQSTTLNVTVIKKTLKRCGLIQSFINNISVIGGKLLRYRRNNLGFAVIKEHSGVVGKCPVFFCFF